MNGYIVVFLALVSALAILAGVSAYDPVSAGVLVTTAGFALGTGVIAKHEGEPAPASPPPPPPEQAPATQLALPFPDLPEPGYPPGLSGVQ